ncbi:MAG TPA: EamA family transporter [Nitrosospira sp.]
MARIASIINLHMTGYFYIFLTIAFTVYGQIVLKWQMIGVGDFPESSLDKALFLLRLLLNPWVMSGFLAAFAASLAWMAAMTKLELSHAYPFMSLNFVFVIILSSLIFQETITPPKIVGLGLIILGIVVGSRG